MGKITVFKLQNSNAIVIKKKAGDDFFITTNDSIIISLFHLSAILKFMLFREIISPKVLQGIIDEYYSFKEH